MRLSGGQSLQSGGIVGSLGYFARMQDRETTIRSRELGDGLREAMRTAGMTGSEVSRRLDWSDSKVSRLLTGKRGATVADVSSILAICGVKSKERDRLLRLCGDVGTPGWLQQHGSRLPKQLRTLIDHEDKAIVISDFQPIVVPGLLQTDQYARCLLSGTRTLPAEEVDDRVAARLARQSLFGAARRPKFTFYLHEFVLRLPAGPADVMSDQLHHLLRMSVRTYITLRVIPAALGVHAGIAGAFKLMEFPGFNPVVYLDSETTSLFLEKEEEITAHRRILEVFADTALSEGESRDVIATLATELYT